MKANRIKTILFIRVYRFIGPCGFDYNGCALQPVSNCKITALHFPRKILCRVLVCKNAAKLCRYYLRCKSVPPKTYISTIRGGFLHIKVKMSGNAATEVCGAVHAVAYGANAIRPYGGAKPNTPKAIWDMGKTMSYAGKIMSDIIQTTSDLFSAVANLWETVSYGMISKTGKLL